MQEQNGRRLTIKRDGQVVAEVYGRAEAIRWLHAHQPQSYDWALRYEGYSVEQDDGKLALKPYGTP